MSAMARKWEEESQIPRICHPKTSRSLEAILALTSQKLIKHLFGKAGCRSGKILGWKSRDI